MTATTFDALRAARDLEAAGVERRQAEVLADALRQAATADRGELAAKTDLAELRADIDAVEGRIYRPLWLQGGAIAAILAGWKWLA